MKKTLIIVGHPSKKGFSHKIAKTIAENVDSAEILDLYDSENAQNFLTFDDPHRLDGDEMREKMQKKIAAADEIVFVFPIWWGDMPAIVKNFFDQNFTSGFAFRYENGKPIGLLKGKTARIFSTADFEFPIFFKIFAGALWKIGRLHFCGISLKNFTILGGKHKKTPAELDAFLEKVAAIVKK